MHSNFIGIAWLNSCTGRRLIEDLLSFTAISMLAFCGTANAVEPAQNSLSAINQGNATAKSYIAKKERGATRFSSFEEAERALSPRYGLDAELMMNPMSLKGQIVVVGLVAAQLLGDGKMLMTSRDLVPWMDTKFYFAYISETYAGPREFVDGQHVDVVGEVIGTYQYTTAMGTSKTVPKIRIYGIRAGQW